MTYTTDQAIALAREYGYGGQQITPEELTAFANAVRKQTLLEAADEFDAPAVSSISFDGVDVALNLRRMAGVE